MTLPQLEQLQQLQRVHVDVEGNSQFKRIKISVENYDEGLGWYSAGSLSLPLHQLPLLEQELQALRHEPTAPSGSNVVLFPGMRTPVTE